MNDRVRMEVRLISVFFIFLSVIGIVRTGFIAPDFNAFIVSIFCFSLFTLLLGYVNKPRISLQEPETFLQAIKKKKGEIKSGGWEYYGMKITPETEIAQYHLTISVIFQSIKIASRFYIIGSENTRLVNGMYSFATLLLGWWGIPWGPIYTIQALGSNLRGGNRIKVATLLEH